MPVLCLLTPAISNINNLKRNEPMIDLESRIKKVISEQLDVEISVIKLDSDLIRDLGADSLGTVELVMAFEEEFDVTIPDDEAENICTVQDVMELISSAPVA